MARQVIVPFARDYIDYLKREMGVVEPTMLPVRSGPAARKVFVVHGHDDGAREKEAWTMTPSSVKTPKMHIRVERIMTFKNSYCSWAF